MYQIKEISDHTWIANLLDSVTPPVNIPTYQLEHQLAHINIIMQKKINTQMPKLYKWYAQLSSSKDYNIVYCRHQY